MGHKQIIYYECENRECNLRFPDLRDDMPRERCPVCRGRIRVVLTIDAPHNENQAPVLSSTKPKLEAMLDNVRSGLNVGSIFRSADGIGVSKLYLCGITPNPENPAVRKTSLGAEQNVSWDHVSNGVVKVRELKMAGYSIWGLESVPSAISLFEIDEEIKGEALILVVGNEVCGIDPDILALCDQIVSIPMVGIKRSLNVASAFGIAASYLRYRQILSQGSVSILPNT